MSDPFLGLLGSWKARLSRRIVFWVFASLFIIEAVLLVPSVQKREKELLMQFKQLSSVKVSFITMAYPNESERQFLARVSELEVNEMFAEVKGGAIYASDGQMVGTFGEPPQLSFEQVNRDNEPYLYGPRGTWYEVAWHPDDIENNDYTLIIRYDGASIQEELWNYKLRIAGLVVLISAVVTSATMVVLGLVAIAPILRLRDDLIAAGEALSKDEAELDFYSLSVKRSDELGEVMEAFGQMFGRVRKEIGDRKRAEAILRKEQEKSDRLLLNILPAAIAEKLKEGHSHIADGFPEVTILFTDLVGFTKLSEKISPRSLVQLLNEIFSSFDALCDRHGLEKIKTIGDAYMVVGGLPMPRKDHAEAIAEIALDMQEEIIRFNARKNTNLSIRIGINTGPVVAGVIGTSKFIYDLWGDAVNTANRMESHGIPGQIQVTEATYQLLQDKYLWKERGIIHVKGKGKMMAYLLVGRNPEKLSQ